jgi:hypothetical protein
LGSDISLARQCAFELPCDRLNGWAYATILEIADSIIEYQSLRVITTSGRFVALATKVRDELFCGFHGLTPRFRIFHVGPTIERPHVKVVLRLGHTAIHQSTIGRVGLDFYAAFDLFVGHLLAPLLMNQM